MPIEIRGTRVTFTAPPGAVALAGDFTLKGARRENWGDSPIPLAPGKSVTLEFPEGAFVEYAFLSEGGDPFADPDNPLKTDNPWWAFPRGVALGGYQPHSLREPLPGAPIGRLERLSWAGRVFPGTRRALVYTPPGFEPGHEYPVFYVQDGVAYARTGKLGTVLDNLLHQGRVRPAVLTFLEPADRTAEYFLNDAYPEFLLSEALPEIESRYPVARHPALRGLWGASLGGLASMYAALRHPEAFGRVVAQSGAYLAEPGAEPRPSGHAEWLVERYAQSPRLPLRIYLEVGKLEWLLGCNRRMAGVLFDKGYPHAYEERPSGHNWATWRDGLADALEFMLGPG